MKRKFSYVFIIIFFLPVFVTALYAAYGSVEFPLTFNNNGDIYYPDRTEYKPHEVRKVGSWSVANNWGGWVYAAASHYKGHFTNGRFCLSINDRGPAKLEKCETGGTVLRYVTIDKSAEHYKQGQFGLGTSVPLETLALNGSAQLVRSNSSNAARFRLLPDFPTAINTDGSVYYRNILEITVADQSVFHAYVKAEKDGSGKKITGYTLKIVSGAAFNASDVDLGLDLFDCRAEIGRDAGPGVCWTPDVFDIRKAGTTDNLKTTIGTKLGAIEAKFGEYYKENWKNIKQADEKFTKLINGSKPNIIYFFVDTLRADAVTKVLTPQINAAFNLPDNGSLKFLYSFSGASNTQHSTYSLVNMRPGFERDRIWNWSGQEKGQNKFEIMRNGGLALAILKKLGYKILLFSRPDYVDTFTFRNDPESGWENKDKSEEGNKSGFPPSYGVQLPLRIKMNFGSTKTTAEELVAAPYTKVYFGDESTPEIAVKPVTDAELGRITNAKHDELVLQTFKSFLDEHAAEIKEGGHMFIIYFSGPHNSQIPVLNLVTKEKKLDLTPPPSIAGSFYEGLFLKKGGGTNELTGVGKLLDQLIARIFTDKSLFAKTYYNQVKIIDNQFKRAMDEYKAKPDLKAVDTYLVLMGDHGEALFENGFTFHGHRPMQKVIEAPILFARRRSGSNDFFSLAWPGKTVTQMDIFPFLFRHLTKKETSDEFFTAIGLSGDIFTAESRKDCHISVAPNGAEKVQQFAIYDGNERKKMMFLFNDTKDSYKSTKLYLTNVTDYWDNPARITNEEIKRCLDILLVNPYNK